jgi:hypothetical protein
MKWSRIDIRSRSLVCGNHNVVLPRWDTVSLIRRREYDHMPELSRRQT